MTDLAYPVLYAPQTDAPVYPADSIIILGRRMSASVALDRHTPEQITGAGYRWPTPNDVLAVATGHVQAAADAALIAAARGYAWPEAAAWTGLEAQAGAWLADPSGPPGPDLLADAGASDPATLTARAAVVVAKADAFRARRGAIVQARRAGLALVQRAHDEPESSHPALIIAAIQAAAADAVAALGAG